MSFRVIRAAVLTVAFATAWLAAGAARSAGPVVGWGDNFSGQTTTPVSLDGTLGIGRSHLSGRSAQLRHPGGHRKRHLLGLQLLWPGVPAAVGHRHDRHGHCRLSGR